MQLSKDQDAAIKKIQAYLHDDSQAAFVLRGAAGTGKSWLTKHVIDLVYQVQKLEKVINPNAITKEVVLTATTHKAAQVLMGKTGREANTIHSVLGIRPFVNFSTGKETFKRNPSKKPLTNAILIVDEASMISELLLEYIWKGVENCKVIFILDHCQLPAVKQSYCSVTSKGYPEAVLEEVLRQAKGSPILDLAQQFRETVETGVFKPIQYAQGHIAHAAGSALSNLIDTAYTEPNRRDDKYKILGWKNKTVIGYNNHVRKLFTSNPDLEIGERVVSNSAVMAPDQSVLLPNECETVIRSITDTTHYGIPAYLYSLDNGAVVPVPKDRAELNIKIREADREKDWQQKTLLSKGFADLRPTHASTVHKSQGSTYHTTFINLSDIGACNDADLVARMLYVAVTRATDRIIFCGKLPPKYSGE